LNTDGINARMEIVKNLYKMEELKIILNSWQFNLSLSLILLIVFMQSYKLAVKEVEKDGVATIILQVVAGLSILFLLPFFAFTFPNNTAAYLFTLLAIIFYTLNDRIQTTVRKNLDVSVYSILDQIARVFLVVYGIIIFKEPLVAAKLLGAGLILAGNVFLFYRKGKLKINRYVVLNVLATFLLATATIIDIDISKQFNLPFYIMITLIIPALFIYLVERHSSKEILKEFNSKRRKYYLITGISWGVLILAIIRAFQTSEVTFIAPLLATSVLLNVFVASIIHKEKSNLTRKIIAAVIVVLGVFVMTQ